MNPLGPVLTSPETQILLVCGSGGVGKTSVAAALAVRAAECGRRVAVMTIDPARRLATALGISDLSDEPQPVASVDTSAGGSLDAMMLDMKRTFDASIRAHSTPERAQALIDNPFYQAVSTSLSGTQEYMAMEKLGSLYSEGVAGSRPRWDLIVVDTPPSASALDFLDAPQRLGSLLDSKLMAALLLPARSGLRIVGAGMGLMTPVLSMIVGKQSLQDLQTFVTAFDSVLGGFRERAERTRRLLSTGHTACLVVTTPTDDPVHEARVLVDRLRADAIRTPAVVVNKMPERLEPLSAPGAGSDPVTAWAETRYEELEKVASAARQRVDADLSDVETVEVPELTDEVVTVDALRRLGDLLDPRG